MRKKFTLDDFIEKATLSACITGVIASIVLIAKELRLQKKISGIEELNKISEKLKSLNKKLNDAYSEFSHKLTKYFNLVLELDEYEKYYKSTKISLDSSSTSNFNYQDSSFSSSRNKSKEQLNPNFNPEKAREYAKKKREAESLEKEIKETLDELYDYMKKVKECNSEFRKIAKKYNVGDEKVLKASNKKIDDLEKEINKALAVLKLKFSTKEKLHSLMESYIDDSYNDVEIILEAYTEGSISKDEALYLLTQ